jgi:hypothetical protein
MDIEPLMDLTKQLRLDLNWVYKEKRLYPVVFYLGYSLLIILTYENKRF